MSIALPQRTALVIGAARSGKSRFAERMALGTGLVPIYVATAEARDDEMAARIASHRRMRADAGWTTIEEPRDLVPALGSVVSSDAVVLVDCLTLWLSNLIEAERDVEAEGRALAAFLAKAEGPVVLVSNEVGAGIVPINALARRFADAQGRLNQTVAAVATQVILVAAGQPLRLKPAPEFQL
ncbi:adenosylcobinamide kinase /adenosylcobinamide-phosphate guanylyltransferase [Kaistia soli DSM 19436]|uniref:Bifunctional adenosylcobalamin biosynthesis protein n=1 Tax=Kaistia soli DSM 19436 TaxID=1122133 RepID=A0A1M5PMS3_9HYPH|nr:bifunctional adenosylcobinamide kinase/adenosylcobinamide-phosphate guanylyltransferase [Kaistia soli]SHH03047.1 adenosylcobinamide kinase /adenosylcobinamide-phosphate guanylyltransferase [Kaistia soli DSM 19436]